MNLNSFQWFGIRESGSASSLVPRNWNRSAEIAADCDRWFPDKGNYTYGLKAGRTAAEINAKTGGWGNVNTTRLVWINGELDPWRGATVSSHRRPGGPLKSTKEAPVHLVRGAAHCSDMNTDNALLNKGAAKMFAEVVSQMQEWVAEFYEQKNKTRGHGQGDE